MVLLVEHSKCMCSKFNIILGISYSTTILWKVQTNWRCLGLATGTHYVILNTNIYERGSRVSIQTLEKWFVQGDRTTELMRDRIVGLVGLPAGASSFSVSFYLNLNVASPRAAEYHTHLFHFNSTHHWWTSLGMVKHAMLYTWTPK